ncbi:hypothetical protein Goari_025216, partial [Gossypium aridum]|nr:hypothetical protein [Gossypium aridum]
MLQNKEHWVVRHVPREVNHVADRITKMSSVDMEGLHV